jgi:hypothetical protein
MPIVETSTDPARPVEVVLMDDALEADATVAPEGDVRFAVSNRGQHPHDLVIVKTDAALSALPLRDDRVHEELLEVAGRVAPLNADGAHDAVFPLTRGRYVVFSNTDGDYQRGLRIELTVQPPEPFDPEHYERGTSERPAA